MEELQASDISAERVIEERKEKFFKFLKTGGSWVYYAILAVIVWINIYIRTLPMKINSATGHPGLWDVTTNTWTLGPDLDPFLFLRYAKEIVKNGSMMAIDSMRYVPLGFNTAYETKLLPYMIAYFHKFLSIFKDVTVTYSAIVLPVVVSVFTTIFFFLFVRKIFEARGEKFSNITALVSTALMVLLPSLLTRTIAGIPEKESVGFCFIFAALYFFLCAWSAKSMLGAVVFGVLAGAMTAALGLSWGGIAFVYAAVAVTGLFAFILGKTGKKEIIAYGSWWISMILITLPFTAKAGFRDFFIAPVPALTMMALFFMIMHFVLFETRAKEMRIMQGELVRKVPKTILTLLVCIVIFIVGASIVFGPSALVKMVQNALGTLNPVVGRLISTVAENKQTSFGDWAGSMGPVFHGIPLMFWLFLIGNVCLFEEMIKLLSRKEKIMLTSAYIVFLFALIFNSKFSAGMGSFIELAGYVLLLASAGYVFYEKTKKNELELLGKINTRYILIFILVFTGIVATHSGIRFMMVLTPIATIVVGYLATESVYKAWTSEKEAAKIAYWAAAIIVVSAFLIIFGAYFEEAKGSALNNVPNVYSQQWQEAMNWVRENTPKDAVFGHWWDYGYWLQSIGERATMLDGGNAIGYWNYLMGRHVLTGETQSEALEVLYNHNVTHFLIDSTDIGKYSAYSLIGGDENYDRYSWIGTFLLDEEQTQETKEQILYVYPGGVGLDEDLLINEEGRQTLLPRQSAANGAMLIYKQKEGDYAQPYSIMVYRNKQYKLPLRYLFVDGKLIDFGTENENTVDGCAYIFPRVEETKVNNIGAAMYLSPKNMRALWVRLYLLGEQSNFRLVHSESSFATKALRAQGMSIGEIVYYRGVQGPIKIWKIEYTGKEKINPEYLQTNFPSELAKRE